jgi:hypothetical protein
MRSGKAQLAMGMFVLGWLLSSAFAILVIELKGCG